MTAVSFACRVCAGTGLKSQVPCETCRCDTCGGEGEIECTCTDCFDIHDRDCPDCDGIHAPGCPGSTADESALLCSCCGGSGDHLGGVCADGFGDTAPPEPARGILDREEQAP